MEAGTNCYAIKAKLLTLIRLIASSLPDGISIERSTLASCRIKIHGIQCLAQDNTHLDIYNIKRQHPVPSVRD